MKKRKAIPLLCLCLAFFLQACSVDDYFTDDETGQYASFLDTTDRETTDSDIIEESDTQETTVIVIHSCRRMSRSCMDKSCQLS